jgi:transcriptional regulator of heat shock response
MLDLTPRQLQIMKAIVEEHIGSGLPVGSETLDKKYNLGISPATIRNEMTVLTKKGLLVQPHTSAGRTPSPTALKLYIKNLMEEKELSVAEEASVKEKIWDHRHRNNRLLQEATRALAQRTHFLAVAATEDGDLFHAGHANILNLPEFYNIDVTRTLLATIDDFDQMISFFQKDFTQDLVHVLLGDELGIDYLEPVGLVYTHFKIGNKVKGSLGVLGPYRLDFSSVIPLVRYFGQLLEKVGDK